MLPFAGLQVLNGNSQPWPPKVSEDVFVAFQHDYVHASATVLGVSRPRVSLEKTLTFNLV